MAAALRHRGPDGRGVHGGPGVGLGVQRLAIVDLATGDQPIGNEDGSVLVVCNGEIYNHVALRAWLEARGHRFRTGSDVEVIVHLYEEEGVESVSALRGMFAFALWDTPRDGCGWRGTGSGSSRSTTPTSPTGLYFASEQKAILAAGVAAGAPRGAGARRAVPVRLHSGARHPLLRDHTACPPGHWLLYERWVHASSGRTGD